MQLGICHKYVFLLLGGAAAAPLKRLGQEDGFALVAAATAVC